MKKAVLESKLLNRLERVTRKNANPANPWPTCPVFFHQPKRPVRSK